MLYEFSSIMDIYLIRHTKPDIEPGICYGQRDLDLADSFHDEWQSIEQKIPGDFDAVYTSPLKRCYQLADRISQNGLIQDDRIKEIFMGDWEMQRWDDLDKAELDPWMDDYVNIRTPNGESFKDVHQRVTAFFEDLYQTTHEKVCVVCHGGVIRTILADTLGMPLNNAFNMVIDYGGMSLIHVKEDVKKVRFINV